MWLRVISLQEGSDLCFNLYRTQVQSLSTLVTDWQYWLTADCFGVFNGVTLVDALLNENEKHNSAWIRSAPPNWKTTDEIGFWTISPLSAPSSLARTIVKVRQAHLPTPRWLRRPPGREEGLALCPCWSCVLGLEHVCGTRHQDVSSCNFQRAQMCKSFSIFNPFIFLLIPVKCSSTDFVHYQ